MGLIWHSFIHNTQIAKEVGVSKAALSLLSVPHDIKDHPNTTELLVKHGASRLNNVTFYYTPECNVFNRIFAKIKGGGKRLVWLVFLVQEKLPLYI